LDSNLFSVLHNREIFFLYPRFLTWQPSLHQGIELITTFGALTLEGILEALLVLPLIPSAAILGGCSWWRILGEDPLQKAEAKH